MKKFYNFTNYISYIKNIYNPCQIHVNSNKNPHILCVIKSSQTTQRSAGIPTLLSLHLPLSLDNLHESTMISIVVFLFLISLTLLLQSSIARATHVSALPNLLAWRRPTFGKHVRFSLLEFTYHHAIMIQKYKRYRQLKCRVATTDLLFQKF